MAVGTNDFPVMHPVNGVTLGTINAGIKYEDRKDLVLMEMAAGTTIGGVFTTNVFCAAPVRICQQHLTAAENRNDPWYLITNTGYANAGTGKSGYDGAVDLCMFMAEKLQVPPDRVLPFSTGVIGEPLPFDKIKVGLPRCVAALTETGWKDAAIGIMTTDTRPKGSSRVIDINGSSVTVTGIAKGAGMIKPNMATMLAYIVTDAKVEQGLLQNLIKEAADVSFNRVTVDGDTSTNDSLILGATGQSGVSFVSEQDAGYGQFKETLFEVAIELAQALIKDGEGATKFVTVRVTGAAHREEADEVAYTVAHSPLVKTALFASDPNWGRILAAVGRARIDNLDVDKVSISLDDVLLVEGGGVSAGYREQDGSRVMEQDEIAITISLGRGSAATEIWTTDFSYDYVKINADYRT